MRSGADLVRATKDFAQEDRLTSWRLLISTAVIQVVLLAAIYATPWWPVKLAGSLVAGLVIVRLFIFFHDYLHGAIFKDSTLGAIAMYVVGFYTLSPPSVWKETHDYHHRNNAKLLGSAIGSYPIVSLAIWRRMTPMQKLAYRAIRHPLTMALASFTMFTMGMCLSPFKRAPRAHWTALPIVLGYWTLAGVLVSTLGFAQAAFLFLIPAMVSSAAGAYLFYAQHNFPGAELQDRQEWNYHHAALRCSSMFDMSPPMHWFTGNIGYHHVHHLNHKIPFYRLPEAMAAMPELQDPFRTSWAPSDILACLRIGLWDARSKKLITFAEAEQQLAARAA